jgi:cytochrome c oxidase assembly protein subunit 15
VGVGRGRGAGRARAPGAPARRRASIAIHSAFGTQILLGIATVMTGVALWLAVLHQLVGALLVAPPSVGAHVAGRRP